MRVLPCFLDEKGNELISLIEISKFVAEICGADDSLLGISEKDLQGVWKVFELPKTQDFSFEKILSVLEKSLTGNMFIDQCVNMKVSDLFIFSFLFRKLVISEDEVKKNFPNVCRWFRFIQSLDGVSQFLKQEQLPQLEKLCLRTMKK